MNEITAHKDAVFFVVKSLKALTGKNGFELLMFKKRRKSLALCPDCFNKTRD
jgi:hypothetical protein